jgi:hypothetical protein
VLPETGTTAATDAGRAASSGPDPFTAFVQGLEQDWINSPFGTQFDTSLNTWAAQADASAFNAADSCGLICNGAAGTATDPNGGNGVGNTNGTKGQNGADKP